MPKQSWIYRDEADDHFVCRMWFHVAEVVLLLTFIIGLTVITVTGETPLLDSILGR